MAWTDSIHDGYVAGRRARRLAALLAPLLPPDAKVLDVGCGDGELAALIARARPDVSMRGIDVLVRPAPLIPVEPFDGRSLPCADDSYDAVMFVDVLHHADDPQALLNEAARVASRNVLIKDHLCESSLDRTILRFMDRVGNSRHGVALPYGYWSNRQWTEGWRESGLSLKSRRTSLKLYPVWADWAFGRSLHFIADLQPGSRDAGSHGDAASSSAIDSASASDHAQVYERMTS